MNTDMDGQDLYVLTTPTASAQHEQTCLDQCAIIRIYMGTKVSHNLFLCNLEVILCGGEIL